ncbi:histidinol-phosphate transaminase [Babesia caballi]|uniref:Histidinol-phosphate transaminase n=1 Tax=Babesia caballi TaxID=5871 RepID=A0AAV4M408_BABCB|nr:histidinol-phosphate transaminase [Babesia caballi]
MVEERDRRGHKFEGTGQDGSGGRSGLGRLRRQFGNLAPNFGKHGVWLINKCIGQIGIHVEGFIKFTDHGLKCWTFIFEQLPVQVPHEAEQITQRPGCSLGETPKLLRKLAKRGTGTATENQKRIKDMLTKAGAFELHWPKAHWHVAHRSQRALSEVFRCAGMLTAKSIQVIGKEGLERGC